MKFTVLIKKADSGSNNIKSKMKEYAKEHDCIICDKKEDCPIFNLQLDIQQWVSMRTDDFDKVQQLIEMTLDQSSAIIVIDGPNDICFVYKAKDTMAEIKKGLLKEALKIYERIEKTAICFSEVRDLRGAPIFVSPILN